MRWLVLLGTSLLIMLFTACERRPLPFPTPAQTDLVVLVQNGPLTYAEDEAGNVVGLEHDLIEAFAQELGVGVRYVVSPLEEVRSRLASGKAHFAAAWFSPGKGDGQMVTPALMESSDILVQHEASLPIDELVDLKERTVHVMAGSRQAEVLRLIQSNIPEIQVVEHKDGSVFDLLQEIGERDAELALVDSSLLDIALQFLPSLQPTLSVGDPRPIVWLFGEKANNELLARANAFIERVQKDGTLARLKDRYLGHVERLRQSDVVAFIERTETLLPKLRPLFQAAQATSGLDWRLLAALAYQESQWDPNAVSPTGVRGIMMLTEETADRMGVSNRLNPRESIMAGARYLSFLRDQLPPSSREPDRTWLALAAYNLGPGHFNAARTLAGQLKSDPDSWYEMKRILPLLAQPKYYERLKAGRARGGEAVILAENIRSYYDILTRFEAAYRPTPMLSERMLGMAGMLGDAGQGPGLKRR